MLAWDPLGTLLWALKRGSEQSLNQVGIITSVNLFMGQEEGERQGIGSKKDDAGNVIGIGPMQRTR